MWHICHIFLPAICGGKLISPIFDFMLFDNFCDIVKNFTVSYLIMLLSIIVSTVKRLHNLNCHLNIKWPFQCQSSLLYFA